ncbi:helix-hairpin-helix domain-containing protein [Candidatus Thorarchaeota archaeon]|nr:MAG: helix-hairpin-helix domain-containing protein [Candidatus Thorarchaeota archaeon]
MSSNKSFTSETSIAVISFALLIAAILLWWTATLLSVLMLLTTMLLWVGWFCRKLREKIPSMEYHVHRPRRVIYRRGNEDLSEFEERIRQVIFDELEETKYESEPFPELSLSDLDETIPVTIVEGLRKECALKLERHEIRDLEDLSVVTASEIMRICSIDKQIAQRWIADARAVTYGAGITSIVDLSMADPNVILQDIMEAVKTGELDFPKGYSIDSNRVENWVRAANKETSSIDYEEVRRWLDRHGN